MDGNNEQQSNINWPGILNILINIVMQMHYAMLMMRNDIEYNSPANRSEVSERNENNE